MPKPDYVVETVYKLRDRYGMPYLSDDHLEDLWHQWSEDIASAGWLGPDDRNLIRFHEWLFKSPLCPVIMDVYYVVEPTTTHQHLAISVAKAVLSSGCDRCCEVYVHEVDRSEYLRRLSESKIKAPANAAFAVPRAVTY